MMKIEAPAGGECLSPVLAEILKPFLIINQFPKPESTVKFEKFAGNRGGPGDGVLAKSLAGLLGFC